MNQFLLPSLHQSLRQKQCGLSLVEIMFSLLLSSILLILLMQQYLSARQHFQRVYLQLEQEIDLQLVVVLMRDSVRQAGFTPCAGVAHLSCLDHRDTQHQLQAIQFEATNSLRLSRMSEHFSSVMALVNANQLMIEKDIIYKPGSTVLIADCYHAEVQTVTKTYQTRAGQIVELASPIAFSYKQPFYLGAWLEEHYFIKPNSRGQLALFYKLTRAEHLTDIIRQFAVQWVTKNNQLLLKIKMELINGNPIVLLTKIRAI